MRIRLATTADGAGVTEVYAPFVRNTAITFEDIVPPADGMSQRIATTLPWHPWIVADDETIVGYAYATRHRSRAAYKWSVETSIYLSPVAQDRGVGTRLYRALLTLLVAQGYCQAFAGMTLPNEASKRLHARLGFEPVGTFRNIGFKFGAWHDVAWWQRPLALHDRSPSEVRPVSELGPTVLAAAFGPAAE
jgi:L-amino acid N-acyltransferase YncA